MERLGRVAPSEEEVLAYLKALSNWGRWGEDDPLGTLNLITDEVARRAAGAVQTGERISCAWDIRAGSRLGGIANRFMVVSGEAALDAASITPSSRRMNAAAEVLQVQFHGQDITHLDALSHMSWDGKMYNGLPAGKVTTAAGATRLGVETVRTGIVTRGVLLDVAAAKGVPYLDLGEGVFPEDLEKAAKREGVQVEPGDAVLLHTGLSRYRRDHPSWSMFTDGAPGWQAACLPWLHERQVSVIGADGNNESLPNEYAETRAHPIHVVGIVAMGLWLIDNCLLHRLADACDAAKRWSFLFVVSPLAFQGATGGPVNPVAVL
jgi:kynurenine formamidase